MITLLLVEDEYYTRKGLLRYLDFVSLGIENVLEAGNGLEGLDYAQKNKIDILLTDIRMPRIDGIELAKAVRALYPDCIILFLSGYSDRDYLRSALSLRTFRYIDKPIDPDTLSGALNEAVQHYHRLYNSAKHSLNETKKLLARQLVTAPINYEDFNVKMHELSIPPHAFKDCCTILIQLLNQDSSNFMADFSSSLNEVFTVCENFFRTYSIPCLMSELKERYILIHLLSNFPSTVSFVPEDLKGLLLNLSHRLELYPHFISIGEPVHSASDLKSSFNNAVINQQRNFFLGINSISMPELCSHENYTLDINIQNSIQQAVINYDYTQCKKALDQLLSEYRSHPSSLISSAKSDYLKLLIWIYHYVYRKYKSNLFQNESYLEDKVNNATTIEDLHTFALHCFAAYFDTIPNSPERQIINTITQIIEKEYSDYNMSVQYICDKINLSVSHASFLFKQETGNTINQYVQTVRIRHAENLLANTNTKISDIAGQTGFADSNYFTKLFHKKTGLLPSEYREVHKSW